MALSHFTKVFAIKDLKVSRMLTDPAGGSATYSAAVDVVGVKYMKVSGAIKTVELRGDNTRLDGDSILTDISVEVGYAKFNYDLMAILLGATVADTGTTPNQVTSLTVTGGLGTVQALPFFKVEGQAFGVDTTTGDQHLVLPKCKISDFPEIGLAEEDYQTYMFKAMAYPRNADGVWLQAPINETAAAPA